MWDLLSASEKPNAGFGVASYVGFVLFSIVTAGTLPLIFATMAKNRRRRLKKFFLMGHETTAEVLDIQIEKMPFEEKIARVNYEFEADGQLWRDADQVLPIIAQRWRVGDRVQVLYIPEWEYDSVIISTG
jgi:hypothetical protein